ncbi:MAG: hypothetical protein QOJ19_2805 [Acidimicrobiia bacterium]|jgi:CheY-like chemotaxis protein/anti-sigma regulatory factor (Ser/Thr protein kinase)|nr:hypothetical protein [Acidimicrobiia bacterium]
MSEPRIYRTVVVEDVPELRALIRRALERSGRFVVVGEAGDGRQGVATARTLRPDVTVLDLIMPVMDGLEALPLIRAAVPDGVVVVVSGLDEGSIGRGESGAAGQSGAMRDLVRQRGAAGYVTKGARLAELVQTLLDLLEPSADDSTSAEPAGDKVCSRHLDLPGAEHSPRLARRFVLEALGQWNVGLPAQDVALMVSELVTNAVVHAESHSQLWLHLDRRVLRVEVHDWGGGALVRRDPSPVQIGGRGLVIVQNLSHRWGTQSQGAGKVVWFEIDRSRVPTAVA